MARVYLGVGSNIEREQHIRSGLADLRSRFDVRAVSSVYESAAVGFNGAPFFNLVVEISADLSVAELQKNVRQIEEANGCQRIAGRYGSRTLDIDILLYDDVVGCVDGVSLPRDEILSNAFVLWPLAEIAPGYIHPLAGKTCAVLWAEFDKSRQYIMPADFVL